MKNTARTYGVRDIQTQQIIRQGLTLRAAYKMIDRLDLAYGACRYIIVRPA